MQSDFLHRNRLEFLGELAASLAHELNQPLNVIRMASENLRNHLPENDDYAQAKINKIINQIDRTSRIVTSIGVFSKAGLPSSERFSLQQVFDQVRELMGSSLATHDIAFQIEVQDKMPFLEGDSVLLEQLLLNLIMNARDGILAKDQHGKKTREKDVVAVVVPARRDDKTLTIKVRDTGIGLGGHDLQDLVQPFFTTKADHGGTGLGLTVCKMIADRINARLSCSDRPSGGAEFSLTLPLPPQREV